MAYSCIDEFTIDVEHEAIVCHSKSGNTYRLTFDENENLFCTCKGFSFRNECRHEKEARDFGYASYLLAITRKNDIEKRESNQDVTNEDSTTDNLFVVCYAEHENRLIVNAEQLITVLDNAKKHCSTVKVFKLGKKVIDWA